jgi:hypothetical protein
MLRVRNNAYIANITWCLFCCLSVQDRVWLLSQGAQIVSDRPVQPEKDEEQKRPFNASDYIMAKPKWVPVAQAEADVHNEIKAGIDLVKAKGENFVVSELVADKVTGGNIPNFLALTIGNVVTISSSPEAQNFYKAVGVAYSDLGLKH